MNYLMLSLLLVCGLQTYAANNGNNDCSEEALTGIKTEELCYASREYSKNALKEFGNIIGTPFGDDNFETALRTFWVKEGKCLTCSEYDEDDAEDEGDEYEYSYEHLLVKAAREHSFDLIEVLATSFELNMNFVIHKSDSRFSKTTKTSGTVLDFLATELKEDKEKIATSHKVHKEMYQKSIDRIERIIGVLEQYGAKYAKDLGTEAEELQAHQALMKTFHNEEDEANAELTNYIHRCQDIIKERLNKIPETLPKVEIYWKAANIYIDVYTEEMGVEKRKQLRAENSKDLHLVMGASQVQPFLKKAEELLLAAAKTDPTYVSPVETHLKNYGEIIASPDNPKVTDMFRNFFKNHPNHPLVLNIGYRMYEDREFELAMELLEHYNKNVKHLPEVDTLLANIYMRTGTRPTVEKTMNLLQTFSSKYESQTSFNADFSMIYMEKAYDVNCITNHSGKILHSIDGKQYPHLDMLTNKACTDWIPMLEWKHGNDKDTKKGFVDIQLNWKLDISHLITLESGEFARVSPFYHNRSIAGVYSMLGRIKSKDLLLLNRKGEVLKRFGSEYESVSLLKDFAAIQFTKSGKSGLMDLNGNVKVTGDRNFYSRVLDKMCVKRSKEDSYQIWNEAFQAERTVNYKQYEALCFKKLAEMYQSIGWVLFPDKPKKIVKDGLIVGYRFEGDHGIAHGQIVSKGKTYHRYTSNTMRMFDRTIDELFKAYQNKEIKYLVTGYWGQNPDLKIIEIATGTQVNLDQYRFEEIYISDKGSCFLTDLKAKKGETKAGDEHFILFNLKD
jgi:hypothetical protein